MNAWLILMSGVLISVVANAMLKQSDGFSNVFLGVCSFILFGIGIYLYGQAVKTLPIGVAYTVWSGIGVRVHPIRRDTVRHPSLADTVSSLLAFVRYEGTSH